MQTVRSYIGVATNVVTGFACASVAVYIRYIFHWTETVLPFSFAYAAILVAAVIRGRLAAVVALVAGGILSWYYILEPQRTFVMDSGVKLSLLGYFSVAAIILFAAEYNKQRETKKQKFEVEQAHEKIEEHQVIAGELNHRVKNILSLVQAIANQTFTGSEIEISMAKFSARLNTLASAQGLLVDQSHKPTADIRKIIEQAIVPFKVGGNFILNGPSIMLRDQRAVWLALALHELSTNAIKYGALTNPKGKVSIDWQIGDPGFILHWVETGGPPAVKPEKKGFGSKLLMQGGMKNTLEYLPTGFRCTMTQKLF